MKSEALTRELDDEPQTFASERRTIFAGNATQIYGSWGQSYLCYEWVSALCAGLFARARSVRDDIDPRLRGLSLRAMCSHSLPDEPVPPEIDPNPAPVEIPAPSDPISVPVPAPPPPTQANALPTRA
jgi:hypothetical protein